MTCSFQEGGFGELVGPRYYLDQNKTTVAGMVLKRGPSSQAGNVIYEDIYSPEASK